MTGMAMTIEQQSAMFGCALESLDAERTRGLESHGSEHMLVTSMLSDVQELIESGRVERARQLINCAKYILTKAHESRLDERSDARARPA